MPNRAESGADTVIVKNSMLAACAMALTLSLSACAGADKEKPDPDRFDTMWVEVTEAVRAAPAKIRPETPFDLNVAYGFGGDSDYDVSEFSTNDRGIVARLCVDDTEQDIYMVARKAITYLGEGDCSTASRQSASVVLDSVRGEIIRGEELMPSAAAEFERGP